MSERLTEFFVWRAATVAILMVIVWLQSLRRGDASIGGHVAGNIPSQI